MLVDAAKHAGPALWQGLMLIALLFWILHFNVRRKRDKHLNQFEYSLLQGVRMKQGAIVLGVFGVILFLIIIYLKI